MKKKNSLKDIAKALGVSVTLVSYVMSGKEKERRVGEEMVKKIRETAKKLNYQPNYHARSLRNNRSQTIGLIVADISNPFFANMARTIEDEANRLNYTVIIGSSDENHQKMKKVLDFLASRQVDGFIIAATEGSEQQIQYLKENYIPFVLVDRYFEDISTNYVIVDNFQASYDATMYLLEKDYKKIGMISYKSKLDHFKNRILGYTEALKNFKIESGDKYLKKVRYSNLKDDIKKSVVEFIDKDKVQAIFFATNTIAIEGLKCLFDLGIKMPEDIDVVAFDESEVYNFFQYAIPHIKQPIKEMGIEAIRILVNQIDQKVRKINQIYLDANLEVHATKMHQQ